MELQQLIDHFENIRTTAKHPLLYLTGQAGTGKAQPCYSKVLTPEGWCRIENLAVNDAVYAADGSITYVIGVYPQGKKPVYRVQFTDGSFTDCCDEHLWLTQTLQDRNAKRSGSVKPLNQIRETLWGRPAKQTHLNHSIPMIDPIQFPERSFYLDPYVLGVLIGDGSLTNGTPSFTNPDEPIIEWVRNLLPEGISLTKLSAKDRCDTYSLNSGGTRTNSNPVTDELKRLDLFGSRSEEKFIPREYLLGSVEQRIKLLRGLMDTDGTVSAKGTSVSFCTTAERLSHGMCELVQSLGGIATVSTKIPYYTHSGERRAGQLAYIVNICLPPNINPFYLRRKAALVVPKSKYKPARYIKQVTLLNAEEDCYCISVEHPEQLYVTDNYIVTHNTYTIKQAIEANPRFAKLSASTGIAGVNLGATTINQVLKYFNTDSLSDAYQTGQLQRNLRKVREEANFLVIDEASMIPYQQLNFIVWALDEINQDVEDSDRLGLILTGDYAQLPPVPGNLIVSGRPVMTKDGQRAVKEPTPWGFKSEEWAKFDEEGHTIKLEKIYRQSDPVFLDAINTIRRGVGKTGAGLLVAAGVEFARELDNHFDGTTIVAKNEEVDRINKIRLSQLPGTTTYLPSDRWWATQVRGWKQPSEWDYIPERLELKPDAYVMCLANQKDPVTGEMIVANGDCGWVREIQQLKLPKYEDPEDPTKVTSEEIAFVVMVELARKPGELVTIQSVRRPIEQRYEPEEDLQHHPKFPKDDSGKPCKVRSSSGRLVWCLGWIDYFPLRLAYASTVHKCLSIHSKVLHREKGRININKVEPGDYILGRNSWVKVKAVQMVGKKRCHRITVGTRQINCSAEHRFPVNLNDGSSRPELVQAQYLRVGQRLCLTTNHALLKDMLLVKLDAEERWEEINKIELLDEISMVDIEIESTDHLFYADGILTHNSQGLSLDRVQIDPRGHFFGQPSMAYVALSRGRTPQGIQIVGSSNLFADRVNIDPLVRRFL